MMQTTIGRLLTMRQNCAAMNMAIDEAILLAQKEQPRPTLRFYDWTRPAFSFGYFQDIAAEVDVAACCAEGIELVKRMTGGGTVVHGWELTWTLILPRAARLARLQNPSVGTGELSVPVVYQRIGECLVAAMTRLGIPAQRYVDAIDANSPNICPNICLTKPAQHDVMLNGKKVAGVSVRRNRNGMLFQGYISLAMPPDNILARVSKHPEFQQRVREESMAIHAAGYVITRIALIQAICETFQLGITFLPGELSPTERAQAADLAKTKYADAAWNFR